jgi:hypothetical protein
LNSVHKIDMRNVFYLIFFFIPTTSFSQTIEDSTKQALKLLCDNKFFEKCETPVNFKYGKQLLTDSLTRYLQRINSPIENGRATFLFILAKNSKVYNVRKISADIAEESNIIRVLQQTGGLWTVGKQNSNFICSYVTLEIEFVDNRVQVNLINR